MARVKTAWNKEVRPVNLTELLKSLVKMGNVIGFYVSGIQQQSLLQPSTASGSEAVAGIGKAMNLTEK